MIPVADGLVDVDNIPGEEIKFGIGDPRWMMRSAAKLYSDISTAILREYSTNAYDAHVMAGHRDPIEVTLPTVMTPFFVVQDHGTGMDLADFRDIYTQFGTSNKRESNDTNGVYGFGSKSGLAYTTQFQVTSVKNGMKISAIVKRKPDWELVMKVVSHQKTDEPNGTRIEIPVHNVDEFRHKADEFYKFWLPGRVIVDGKTPEHAVGEQIIDGLYYSEEWNESRIVMGNVPYRINNPRVLFNNTQMNHINFVAYVDNGEVEFTPSREDLEYTVKTKATLHRVVTEFESKIKAKAESEIKAATTHTEAYAAWKKWTEALGKGLFADLEFQGDKFKSDYLVVGKRYRVGAARYSTQQVNNWNVESTPKTLFVTEFDLVLSSRHKAMAKDYANLKGWSVSYVIYTKSKADEIDCPWIDKTQFVTFEDMKAAVPKVRKSSSGFARYNPNEGRVPGSWNYFTSAGFKREKPLPNDDGQEVLWISLQAAKSYQVGLLLSLAGKKNTVVIEVPGNREEKFLRENPNVKRFQEVLKTWVNLDGPSILSDDAKMVLGIEYNTRRWVENLDHSKIDDPHIAHVAKLVSDERELLAPYEKAQNLATHARMRYDFKEYEPAEDGYDIYDKYPLLEQLNYYGSKHDHLYLYLNAVHAAETEKKDD